MLNISLSLLLLLSLGGCALLPAAPAAARADVVTAVPQDVEPEALAAAQAFEQETGNTVRVVAFSADAYLDQVSAALLAGLPDYDLVLLPGDSLGRWVAYHAIRPVPAAALPGPDRAAVEAWLPALEVRGELYGLPAQPAVEALWFRTDLFAAAGLDAPRTWDEVRAAALALNNPPGVSGIAIAGSGLDAGSEFAAVLAGFGGQVVGQGSEVSLSAPAAQQALAFFAGMSTADRSALPGSEGMTRAGVVAALAEARAAMGIAPLAAAEGLRDCAAHPAACEEAGSPSGPRPLLDWTWLPGLAETGAFGSLQAWAVPKRAAHPEAGQAFAAWLCGEAGSTVWAANGGTPVNQGVLAGLGREGAALARVDSFSTALPQVARVDALWKSLHAAAHAATAGEATPAGALKAAAGEVERTLRRDPN